MNKRKLYKVKGEEGLYKFIKKDSKDCSLMRKYVNGEPTFIIKEIYHNRIEK